ncbi:MAG TPA: phosphate ABC transporter substrate-binding protein PstS [Gemmataceae bacterium]|nr:phosphate ABC transporter substrate-binding protein PstS [Gemmataceae bacterium]
MDQQNNPVVSPAKRRVSVVRILVLTVIGVVLGLLVYFSPQLFTKQEKPPAYPQLKMGGTSTVFYIVDYRWRGNYRDAKGVQISYESAGSTVGANRLLDGTYTIAFTHSSLSAEQRKKAQEQGGDVVHIPVLLCGVAPVYNVKELKGKPPLKLTGELLADIFLGKIKEWNDPRLKEVNPGVELPATKIAVVHRQDSSGTTQIFTEYLSAVSSAWRERVGPPKSVVKWPVGVGAARNLGVATLVNKTEGAIGYVDRMYTTFGKMVLDYAAMQNRDKTGFVRADPENMTASAASILADIPDDLIFNLANKPGKDSYPISGVIYAVCYQTLPAETQQRVVDFLHWATHEGQPYAANLAYAPLPPELVERIDKKLKTIKAVP